MSNSLIVFFDPIRYLEDKGIDYSTNGPNTSAGWINIDCPWCGDTRRHLGIHLASNACHCWRCGKKSLGKLIRTIEGCSWNEALRIIEQYQDYHRAARTTASNDRNNDEKTFRQISLPKEFVRLDATNMDELVKTFLSNRGFDPVSIVKEKKLYYSDFRGVKYKFRLGIPIFIKNRLVSFMTRDVTGKTIPYISCPDRDSAIPCKHTLYGYDDTTPGQTVVIVEGPIDQWKLGRGALATWGTGWTTEQVALLRTLFPKKVFILFDNESAAQESAKRLSRYIWFCDSEVISLEDKKDPGELSVDEGRQLMKQLL